MTCEETRRHVHEAHDDDSGAELPELVRAHVAACTACRDFEADLRSLTDALRALPPAPLPAETLDTSEDVHRVALVEALIQQIDVVPDPRLDSAARIGELERQVCRPGARAPALLLRDREDALDCPVFGELRDRRHVLSL